MTSWLIIQTLFYAISMKKSLSTAQAVTMVAYVTK